MPDGLYEASSSAYLFNGFDPSQPLYSNFSVASGTAASGSAGGSLSPTTVESGRSGSSTQQFILPQPFFQIGYVGRQRFWPAPPLPSPGP